MTALNLIAGINQLGYGQVGVNLLKAAAAAGTEVALWPLGGVDPAAWDADLVRTCVARQAAYDPHAPCLRVWHEWDLAQFVGTGPHAGYPFFELDALRPAARHHLACLDVVFVSSAWAKGVLEANGVPAGRIAVAPPGVDTTIFHPDVAPATLGPAVGPATTVFLHCGKWEVRKGADALLDAFGRAFTPADDVHLVMNCYNPCLPRAHSDEWRDAFLNSPPGRAGKVTVPADRLPTQRHVAALMAAADCGVFPARAEGWGLESAEMLAMGKAVVMTDAAAHAEYAAAAGARVVRCDATEEAYDGVFFHGEGRWAALGADQVDQLVGHLRAVHREKREGRLARNEAGVVAFRDRFTWANCYAAVAAALAGA